MKWSGASRNLPRVAAPLQNHEKEVHVSEESSCTAETLDSTESAEMDSLEGGLPDLCFDLDMEQPTISDEKRRHITRLIGRGQCLDVRDLEHFYQWIDDSYNALGFEPLWQQRFDECCRSFCGSNFTRVCLGLSILKSAVGEDP
ncbi:MAG: hypothetical protein V1792_23740 [Pseudomonadota bacterium]